MADTNAPSQLSKFGAHRHGKLVNPQKKLRDRFAHLIEVAGLAEAAHVHIGSAFTPEGLPTIVQSGEQADPATEDQREAYLFFHHHTHLIFMVYRLYVRSFLMPLSVSQNDLPLVDVTTLLSMPAAVATTLSSTASAIPLATVQSHGPTCIIKKLVSDPQIRNIASSVPCFLALSPAFYAHTNVAGLGAPSEGTRNSQMAAGRIMTASEAINVAGVLRQIVLALATDFATLLPLGVPSFGSIATHKASNAQTMPAGPLLMRHQLLLAVIFEVQQLTQPNADYGLRRLGYELLLRIYNFRMAGCIVPTAADRASLSNGAVLGTASISTLEGNTVTIDLSTATAAKKSLPPTAAPINPVQAKAKSVLADAEGLLRDITFIGQASPSSQAPMLDTDGTPLPGTTFAHEASFAAVSDDERLIVSLIDWDYFITLYSNSTIRIPDPLKPQRSPNVPDTSGALSTDAFSAFLPYTLHECLPMNPSCLRGGIEIRMTAHQTSSAAFQPDQPRADRAKEGMAMLQLLLDMPRRGVQLARKGITPATFPYEVASATGLANYCQLNPVTYRKAAAAVGSSLKERWWALMRRTLIRYLYPAAFFEATYHHEERLAGRGPSTPATIVNAGAPIIPFYIEGFRNGPHPLIHASVVDTVHLIYTNGRSGTISSPLLSTKGPTSSANLTVGQEGQSRHLVQVISASKTSMDACLEAEEPYPKELLPASDALAAYLSQDLRLIALLCMSSVGDAGASPSGDAHDNITPLACPPRVVIKSQSVLLDMIKRPAACTYPKANAPSSLPRSFPLSDYMGMLVEGSFLMLATPTLARARSKADTDAEANLLVVTGAPSIPQLFPETQNDPSEQRMTFLEVLQSAADIGLPRAQIALDTLSEFQRNALSAMHQTREQRHKAATETEKSTAFKKDEAELEAIVTTYYCDPAQSSLYNYRAYYVSDDMSSRKIRGAPMAGLHYLLSARITQAIANTTANTSPSASVTTAAQPILNSSVPQHMTMGEVCAQIESLAELFHAIATCDDSAGSALGLTSATSSFAAGFGSIALPSQSPHRLTSTRVKHAAVNALAAMVAEVTLLGLQSTPAARAALLDTIAYINKCLWSSCCAKVDSLAASFTDPRSSLSDTLTSPTAGNEPKGTAHPFVIDYVAAPHDASTFGLLIPPFLQRVLDCALRGTVGNPTTFGGLKACDDTIHSTMGSSYPVPLVFELWGLLVSDLIVGNWLTAEPSKYLPLFGWGVQPASAVAAAGTLLGTYRSRRTAIATDSIRGYIVSASAARGMYEDKKPNTAYRVGHSALAIYFRHLSRDSLCVRQAKGEVLCSLISAMCAKRRNANLDAEACGLNGLTLLAALLPYVGPLTETRSPRGSLLPVGAEAASRIAELVALPPLHSTEGSSRPREGAVCTPMEAALVLYASAVSYLSVVLPLPPALVGCLESGIRIAMGTSNVNGSGHGPLAWLPSTASLSPQNASMAAAAIATAIAKAITAATDVDDTANVLLINGTGSLTDADINTIVAGQRVMQQLCRPNTPSHLGKPASSLVATDISFPLYSQGKSIRVALLPPLLEVACLTLLLAPTTKYCDIHSDYTTDDKFKYETSYSGPVSYYLVARGDKAVVPTKVTAGGKLFRRAMAVYHDLANKKICALLVVEWALGDLMAADHPDHQTVYKLLTLLEASLHSAGSDYPFAQLARVLAKAAALILSPSVAALKEGRDPIDFALAHRLLAVVMQLWSDPHILRKDIRLIGVFGSCLDVVSNGLVALFKLKAAHIEGSSLRGKVVKLYSSFVTSLCASVFYYNHDQTWGVDPKMIHSNAPPPTSAAASPRGPANVHPPSDGRQSPPTGEGDGSALSLQKKRYSVARQSIATSTFSTALVDATAAFIQVLIRLTEMLRHLGLPADVPQAPSFEPITLRQLLVDVVHLLHYGQTSMDYWVQPCEMASSLLPLKHRPIAFQAHELAGQQQGQTSDEDEKLNESLAAVRGTLLQHLHQAGDMPRRVGEELLRLGEIRLGRKPRAHSPPSATTNVSPQRSQSQAPTAPASQPWLYVGSAKRSIATRVASAAAGNSPSRRSKADTESPYGRCLAAVRAVLQETWVLIEKMEADKIGVVALPGCVANFENAPKAPILSAFREAERLLAELTAETVKAAGHSSANMVTSPTDNNASSFLGVSMVAVPGRSCIMCPWVHLTTAPTGPSYLLQRLHGSHHTFVTPGQPVDAFLRQVHTLIDETAIQVAQVEATSTTPPPHVTLSTALCRGPLVLHFACTLLQRSLECQSGLPVPSEALYHGMSAGHSITVLKGDQRLSSDVTTIIGTDASNSDALRIVYATGAGATAFTVVSARENKNLSSTNTPTQPSTTSIVPVSIPPAAPTTRLDELLMDFNKGLFVPLAKAGDEKAPLVKAAEAVSGMVEEIVTKRRGMSVYNSAPPPADEDRTPSGTNDDHDAFSEPNTLSGALALQQSVALLSHEAGAVLGDSDELHLLTSKLLSEVPASNPALSGGDHKATQEEEKAAAQYTVELAARRAAFLSFTPIQQPFGEAKAPHTHKTFDFLTTAIPHAFVAPTEVPIAYSHAMITTLATNHQPLPRRSAVPSANAPGDATQPIPTDLDSGSSNSKAWVQRQQVLVINASTTPGSLCPQLSAFVAGALTSPIGSAAVVSVDSVTGAAPATGGAGPSIVMAERTASTQDELLKLIAAAVSSSLVVVLTDSTATIEAVARRFGKEPSSTVIFLQPVAEKTQETTDNENKKAGPTSVIIHLLRSGLGAHMAPLQDGMMVPLSTDKTSSPLASLLRAAVSGVAGRSSVTQFAIGQGVPLEFTAAFPTTLRIAAAANLHLTCVSDGLVIV